MSQLHVAMLVVLLIPPDAVAPRGRAAADIDLITAGETAIELFKESKDPDARWRAIRILGGLRYERAIPVLLEALSDPHRYMRVNAARALGDMKVKAAAGRLAELLKKETDGGVIEQTSLALANLGAKDAVGALKGVAGHNDVQTRMRWWEANKKEYAGREP